jgi:ribose 5-phosphate isomerase B
MRVGIVTDHGGFGLKEELIAKLRAAGHEVTDFGAHTFNDGDDYPDFIVPLANAVVAGKVERGVAICGSRVGASVCANKVKGVRAALVHDHFSAKQGVKDDHMNILCMGGLSGRKWPGIWSKLTWRQPTARQNGICAVWVR